MDGGQPTSSISDPGLAALVMLLRFQGVGIDPEQIAHQFGGIPIGVPEMLRCARRFGVKARSLRTKWEKLISDRLRVHLKRRLLCASSIWDQNPRLGRYFYAYAHGRLTGGLLWEA